MIRTIGLAAVGVCLGLASQTLKSEVFLSKLGLYQMRVPVRWTAKQKLSSMFEHLTVTPKNEPAVSLSILSRHSDRPMTSIHNDEHLRETLAQYGKEFSDIKVEKGPSRVPVGNEISWSYMVVFNTKAKDGSKISVRDTISYINRRITDRGYIHHVIIGRCPLHLSYGFSPRMSRMLETMQFFKPGKAPEAVVDDDEEAAGPAASASPGAAPAASPRSKVPASPAPPATGEK